MNTSTILFNTAMYKIFKDITMQLQSADISIPIELHIDKTYPGTLCIKCHQHVHQTFVNYNHLVNYTIPQNDLMNKPVIYSIPKHFLKSINLNNFNVSSTSSTLYMIYSHNDFVWFTENLILFDLNHIGHICIKEIKHNDINEYHQITIDFSVDVIESNSLCPIDLECIKDQIITINSCNEIQNILQEIQYKIRFIDSSLLNRQVITPWIVTSVNETIDYNRLLDEFGCSSIDQSLLDRIEKITKKPPHHFLRRNIFFSHRDLDKLLTHVENGGSFYLYTGRGPSSSSLHIGHLVPFMFTKYLQDAFNVPLVIQLTDDEKFLFNDKISIEQAHAAAYSNARDIIACGFDAKKTLIFTNIDMIQMLYSTALQIQKKTTFNQVRGIFGFNSSDNIGKISFPSIQAAPSFPSCFQKFLGPNYQKFWCLIPQAIDQDPYFRMTRDVAPKLGYMKPCLIHSKFIPSLQGTHSKMSSSLQESTITCADTPQQIKKKINKYAFSGGGATIQEHQEKGANIDIDVSIQLLNIFLEDDDELENIKTQYKNGKILTGQVKSRVIHLLQKIILEHQITRKSITEETVKEFMNYHRVHI